MAEPIEIFFSYAHEDEQLMNECRQQLVLFERQDLIRKWHDRQIPAGSNWKGHIDDRLEIAKIILLFVSSSFFDSNYCYDAEMKEALRREESGKARVIPIILRPCMWDRSPISHLQVLPTDGKPLTTWTNKDEGCLNIAQGIMKIVSELNEQAVAQAKSSEPSVKKRSNSFTVTLAVLSPDDKRQVSCSMSKYSYYDGEIVYTFNFTLRDLVDDEFQERINLNVRIESAKSKQAERSLTHGLSHEQLDLLSGPVTDRAKTLPPGTKDDQKLVGLLRKTFR